MSDLVERLRQCATHMLNGGGEPGDQMSLPPERVLAVVSEVDRLTRELDDARKLGAQATSERDALRAENARLRRVADAAHVVASAWALERPYVVDAIDALARALDTHDTQPDDGSVFLGACADAPVKP